MITKKAYAKVNIGLDVTGVRPNGYHDVKMIMQTIDLFDVLTFEKFSPAEGESLIRITCTDETLSVGEDNLIYKAAKVLMERYAVSEGVSIGLEKNIPIAAGMAGGSADCAATLKGVNELFELGLSEKDLREIGVTLGADVPYCILGGTALSEGIGEILTPVAEFPDVIFLIAKPEQGVSTKVVYTNLDHTEKKPSDHPDIDKLIAGIATQDMAQITAHMGNILELVTIPLLPKIQKIKDIMEEKGALKALMSGSGPTVFGIFTEQEAAWEAQKALSETDLVHVIHIVGTVH